MREILFRGKRTDNGQWIYGYYFFENINVYANFNGCHYVHPCGQNQAFSVIPETVGQYTGLTDKNGTKIFEGDIFKFSDEIFESYYTSCGTEYNSWEVENYGVVGFCEDTGRFDFVEYKFNENSVEADLHENHDIEFYEFVSDLEIIGNIHDTPEMLEGGEQE